MKRRIKKEKTKNKNNDKLNNSNISSENPDNEFSILNNNSIIIDKEINNIQKDNDEEKDIFESALLLMDEKCKNGLSFTTNYEPNFSINYPGYKCETIPIFTPSTKLNKALQIGEKNDCFIYYYTQKKSLYPTIYSQLIGVGGSKTIFNNDDLNRTDFIWDNSVSIIFTNQKNFINLNILINEYINPLMRKFQKTEEEKKIFIKQLCKNIIIQEYFSYEELFIKINELNILLNEHKITKVSLIIIDGLNSINPHKLDIRSGDNGKGFKLKFYKYNMDKFDQNSNKKNKRISHDNERIRKHPKIENSSDIKENLYGNNSSYKNKYDKNSRISNNDIFHQRIIDLIINYQEKYNFSLILTVFDFTQYNFYNSCFSGKIQYNDKNVYSVNCPELKKENCYFTFKLPNLYFPKKIFFLEPINLNLNFNDNIFGLITNPINSKKLEFHVFIKKKDDYRTDIILGPIEYEFEERFKNNI